MNKIIAIHNSVALGCAVVLSTFETDMGTQMFRVRLFLPNGETDRHRGRAYFAADNGDMEAKKYFDEIVALDGGNSLADRLRYESVPDAWQWRHPRATGGDWYPCPDGHDPEKGQIPEAEYRPLYAHPPSPEAGGRSVAPVEVYQIIKDVVIDKENVSAWSRRIAEGLSSPKEESP